jgi:putative alpha-1,2-mannosidase
MIPGVGGFSINSPIFPEIKVHLKNGDVTIKGGSEDRTYIHSMKLNKKSFNGTWVDWKDIESGATIEYKLSEKTNFKWGTQVTPPSYN